MTFWYGFVVGTAAPFVVWSVGDIAYSLWCEWQNGHPTEGWRHERDPQRTGRVKAGEIIAPRSDLELWDHLT